MAPAPHLVGQGAHPLASLDTPGAISFGLAPHHARARTAKRQTSRFIRDFGRQGVSEPEIYLQRQTAIPEGPRADDDWAWGAGAGPSSRSHHTAPPPGFRLLAR